MIVHWTGHDIATLDAALSAASAALQQDWAYGSSFMMLGVPVLRAKIYQDQEPVAEAQLIMRKWVGFASFALYTRGPVWLKQLLPNEEAGLRAAQRPTRGASFSAISVMDWRASAGSFQSTPA